MKYRIAIAADHGGFELKEDLKHFLEELGHQVLDFGTDGEESVHYPGFAELVARQISRGEVERGILICGTGIGMSVVANKFPGVRAALCHDLYTAIMSRRHNDANCLALGGRVLGKGLAREMVKAWLETSFDGGRHGVRLAQIREIERGILESAEGE
ncbi:MAG: ribose 5-phosphate isomerase B [Thermodesulfobacteriota bacterium]